MHSPGRLGLCFLWHLFSTPSPILRHLIGLAPLPPFTAHVVRVTGAYLREEHQYPPSLLASIGLHISATDLSAKTSPSFQASYPRVLAVGRGRICTAYIPAKPTSWSVRYLSRLAHVGGLPGTGKSHPSPILSNQSLICFSHTSSHLTGLRSLVQGWVRRSKKQPNRQPAVRQCLHTGSIAPPSASLSDGIELRGPHAKTGND